jgi:hypothetical protein
MIKCRKKCEDVNEWHALSYHSRICIDGLRENHFIPGDVPYLRVYKPTLF